MGAAFGKMDCLSSQQSNDEIRIARQGSHSSNSSVSKSTDKLSQSKETSNKCRVHRKCIKVLFLDVDGVLNNQSTPWNDDTQGIDNTLLKFLKVIVDKSHCKIVLSTTWRLYPIYRCILLDVMRNRADININDVIIGQTPYIPHRKRTTEILSFIEQYNANPYNKFEIRSFCILDDLPLHTYPNAEFLEGHFVRTDKKQGMSISNAVECIQILCSNFDDYW